MVNARNANLQCTGNIHQAAQARAMATEIGAVKQAVGKPVEVVDDAESVYVDLRDGSQDIELQEQSSGQ